MTTDEEKRILIANACGIESEDIEYINPNFAPSVPELCGWRYTDESGDDIPLPDYLNDLNAMHEAVMSQPQSLRKAMRFELYRICGQMEAHDATARQRAEAFGRTLNLWESE